MSAVLCVCVCDIDECSAKACVCDIDECSAVCVWVCVCVFRCASKGTVTSVPVFQFSCFTEAAGCQCPLCSLGWSLSLSSNAKLVNHTIPVGKQQWQNQNLFYRLQKAEKSLQY